jgi:heme exporter protein B
MKSASDRVLVQIVAVLQKEWLGEARTKSGLGLALLLCACFVGIINVITLTSSVNAVTAASLFWMAMIFTAGVTLPRILLSDVELKSADFWKLYAHPKAVYWGKGLFAAFIMSAVSLVLVAAFLLILNQPATDFPRLFLSSLAGSFAIAFTVVLASAVAAPAVQPSILASVISIPLLIWILNLGVTATATAFGEPIPGGEAATPGMILYAIGCGFFGEFISTQAAKRHKKQ